jgi:hypothetical protein
MQTKSASLEKDVTYMAEIKTPMVECDCCGTMIEESSAEKAFRYARVAEKRRKPSCVLIAIIRIARNPKNDRMG